jgi:hypothetical protein
MSAQPGFKGAARMMDTLVQHGLGKVDAIVARWALVCQPGCVDSRTITPTSQAGDEPAGGVVTAITM